jgi:hypothetical protein
VVVPFSRLDERYFLVRMTYAEALVLVVTDYDDGNLKEGVKTTTEGKYSALIT